MLQQLINGLMLGSVYVLVAVAFTLSIGILNFLNFSIPGLFMLGGMISWVLITMGVPPVLSFAIAFLIACVCALVVERLTFSWMKGSEHEVPLVSSLGFLILFEQIFLVYYGSDQQRFPQIITNTTITLGDLVIGSAQLLGLVLSVAIVIGISRFLKKTRVGRGIRAIAEDTTTAEFLGVNTNRVVPLIFLISGAVAAIGGMLFAVNYNQVSPFMGEEVGFKGISAMIIGGMGSVWGAIAGGLLIGLAEVMSIYFLGSDVVDLSVYGLLLIILMARPQGLFGSAQVREKL